MNVGSNRRAHGKDTVMAYPHTSRAPYAAGLLAAMIAVAGPARAAEPPVVVNFLPGEACPGFGLQVELYVDAAHLTFRTFIDKNGNLVRVLQPARTFR